MSSQEQPANLEFFGFCRYCKSPMTVSPSDFKDAPARTINRPHRRISGSDVFVDLQVEHYAEEGVTDEATKKQLHDNLAGFRIVTPFCADIPPGFTGFSDKGLVGNVLVGNDDEFRVCDKSEISTAGLVRLPDGWTKTIIIAR